MAIEVRYGDPGVVGTGAYKAGSVAGTNRVDNRERQLDFQRAMAEEAFDRDLSRMDIQNRYAVQEDQRNLDSRLKYLQSQDDMERQQIKQKRDKYLSQKQQIDEMQAQGKIAPEQYDAAMQELQGRYGDVADVYIPPESVQQQMDQPLWTAPNGEQIPLQITKDGQPDMGKTWEIWRRMENAREEIRVKQEEAEYEKQQKRREQEFKIMDKRAGYELKLLSTTRKNKDGEDVFVYTPAQARYMAMEAYPDPVEIAWVDPNENTASAQRQLMETVKDRPPEYFRRREAELDAMLNRGQPVSPQGAAQAPGPGQVDLATIVARAEQGDPEALAALAEMERSGAL